MSWQPGCSRAVLQARAQMLQGIRAFFTRRDVLEVETPLVSRAANTDPAIDSFEVCGGGYLHTSPEFAMKRLLSAGAGDIYQICKVFRRGEAGRYHNPEFTLLEWYRLGFDAPELAAEVVALVRELANLDEADLPALAVSYRELFKTELGIDPLAVSVDELINIAQSRDIHPGADLSRDGWLDLLLSHCITPNFPDARLTVLHSYPASQAALARLHPDEETAARFELYWGDLELANGYHELVDAVALGRRFEQELEQRKRLGMTVAPLDERLIAAVEAGLPDCSGVALGLDRLLMKIVGATHIDEVLTFGIDRA